MAAAHGPAPRRVVIAGGGPAGVETMLALGDLAGDRVATTLVAPGPDLELKPLHVAAPFGADSRRRYPLATLAAAVGARVVTGALARVRAPERVAELASGQALPYDDLVVAVGARPRAWLPGALTVGTGRDDDALAGLPAELERAAPGTIAFVVPEGATWPLPLYELALLVAGRLRATATAGVRLVLLEPGDRPLALFGGEASTAVERLLAEAGVELRTASRVAADGGVPDGARIVTLPVFDGPRVAGLPADADGFLPVDDHGRVRGADHVFAAGDATDSPVKQGGLATQQADAVAHAIAAAAGAPVEPVPFAGVLRGKLLTGLGAAYLRAGLRDEAPGASVSADALWWPPGKLSGRWLSVRLAALDGPGGERAQPRAAPAPPEPGVDVDAPLPARRGGAGAPPAAPEPIPSPPSRRNP